MNKKRRRNNIIIATLCAVVLVLAGGYALFSTNLNISSSANVTNNWNIKIINIEGKDVVGNAGNAKDNNQNEITPTYSDLSASFSASLTSPGDSITYYITLKNNGSLDAYLKDINKTMTGNSDLIKISFSGFSKGQIIKKNTEETVKVKVEFLDKEISDLEGNTELTVNLNFDFAQQATGENGEDITKYLVEYDCEANGGTSCDEFNEYLEKGSEVDLSKEGKKIRI